MDFQSQGPILSPKDLVETERRGLFRGSGKTNLSETFENVEKPCINVDKNPRHSQLDLAIK